MSDERIIFFRNYCVCCGEEIPEGRQICYRCEKDDTYPRKEDTSKISKNTDTQKNFDNQF